MDRFLWTIGVDPLGESLYLALLDRPGQTKGDLAAIVDPSRDKLASALDHLVARGLITRIPGRPVRYSAIAPDVAVEALARQQINDARSALQLIPDLMELYWQAPHAAVDFIEIVTGPVEVLAERVRHLHAAAQDSVRAFERPPFPWQPGEIDRDRLTRHIQPDLSVEQRSLERKVIHKVIYEQAQVEDPDRWQIDIAALLAAGEEARVLPDLPIKLILFDDVAATTPLVDVGGGYLGSVVIHRSPLLDALSALFESQWEKAVPLTPQHPSIDDLEDPQGVQLAALMAAGLTDDAIARTMGISRSTVLRRVKDQMRQTGAQTRYQLGLQIGRALP